MPKSTDFDVFLTICPSFFSPSNSSRFFVQHFQVIYFQWPLLACPLVCTPSVLSSCFWTLGLYLSGSWRLCCVLTCDELTVTRWPCDDLTVWRVDWQPQLRPLALTSVAQSIGVSRYTCNSSSLARPSILTTWPSAVRLTTSPPPVERRPGFEIQTYWLTNNEDRRKTINFFCRGGTAPMPPLIRPVSAD